MNSFLGFVEVAKRCIASVDMTENEELRTLLGIFEVGEICVSFRLGQYDGRYYDVGVTLTGVITGCELEASVRRTLG